MNATRLHGCLATFLLLPLAIAQADVRDNPWHRAGRAAVDTAKTTAAPPQRARNVILFVGDGMGIATVGAARILEGQLRGETGEENLLSFEHFPWLALAKTYNTNQMVPDSAGTITAMLSGVKTQAGVIGVDESVVRGDASSVETSRIPSLFEQAEARGLSTGIVSTSRVTHATPAGAYAHSPDRNWESDGQLPKEALIRGFPDIALQLLQFPNGSGRGLDVVLGGGRREFVPEKQGKRRDERDLVAEWQAARPNRRLVSNRAELASLEPQAGQQVLGLFSDSHMHFESDRAKMAPETEPPLAEMTAAAIRLLQLNSKGYVLVVEGARIDHAHHMNNAHRALIDTLALADAVSAAIKTSNPKETLILVTADHGHPISLHGYATRGNPILGRVMENNDEGAAKVEPALDLTGTPYTILSYAGGPGYAGATDNQEEGHKTYPHFPREATGISKGRPQYEDVDPRHLDHLQEATLPLAYGSHSGEDVPVYATGPGSNLVHGVIEQNVIYHVIVEALGWNEAAPKTPQALPRDSGKGSRP